jgi:hypothetical protein
MRVMVIIKGSEQDEAAQPTEEMLRQMGNFNDQLIKAGVMLAGEGLLPSAKGVRVSWTPDGKLNRTDGPFAESKELVGGYWIWQVQSMDEAVEWLKRSPFRAPAELELRQVAEADDFGDEFTPELREQEQRHREAIAGRER